jgi:hypothetical protein
MVGWGGFWVSRSSNYPRMMMTLTLRDLLPVG